jgi:hypothetical protein
MSEEMERNKFERYNKGAIWAMYLGFFIAVNGFIIFSLQETKVLDVGDQKIPVTYQPFMVIGFVLILIGVIGLVGGLIFRVYYHAKLKRLNKEE